MKTIIAIAIALTIIAAGQVVKWNAEIKANDRKSIELSRKMDQIIAIHDEMDRESLRTTGKLADTEAVNRVQMIIVNSK